MINDMSDATPDLSALLERNRARLVGFVRGEGKQVLRFESEDDLVQGIHVHALAVEEHFEYRSDNEFIAWLFTVARQHIVNRQRYWSAARRDGGNMLRVTSGGGNSSVSSGIRPAASQTGPGTLAGKREQLALATKVVGLLSERDQRLIQWMSEDVPLEEVAERLDLTYDAAKRARLRAMERFRQTFELIQKKAGPPEEA